MFKITVLLFSVLLISGCAASLNYKSQYTKNPEASEEYNFSGNIERNVKTGILTSDVENNLVIYINDDLVIKGPLHMNESGQLLGAYKSKAVTADCRKPNIFTSTECIIHVDNKKVGKLVFVLGN